MNPMNPTSARRLTAGPLVALVLISGCSAHPAPYAQAYVRALEQYQGTPEVTTAMTQAFVEFFTHDAGRADASDPGELYGSPLYFSDTLLTTGNRQAALEHLRTMRASTDSMSVTVLDRQIDGQDAYVVWRMQAMIEPGLSQVTSDSVGVTHLRFDHSGRIILQQDFWDSAEGFYRHVPVLGRLIAVVKSRFERSSE